MSKAPAKCAMCPGNEAGIEEQRACEMCPSCAAVYCDVCRDHVDECNSPIGDDGLCEGCRYWATASMSWAGTT